MQLTIFILRIERNSMSVIKKEDNNHYSKSVFRWVMSLKDSGIKNFFRTIELETYFFNQNIHEYGSKNYE